MQYLTLSHLRQVLDGHGLRPRQNLGQNFLIDGNIVRIITAQARPADLAVDIGAGPGILTLPLSDLYDRVLAVEIDERFRPVLHEVLCGHSNVEVVFADARTLNWREAVGDSEVSVFGNLPYGAAAPILNNLLESGPAWVSGIFMLQREVAKRLTAGPGSKDYGILTLAVGYYAHTEIVHRVGPRAFYPSPDVDSCVVRLLPRQLPPVEFDVFIRLVRGAFRLRRKTVRNSLSRSGEIDLETGETEVLLRQSGIDPRRRGESLSMDEYVSMASNYREMKGDAT